ncbi:hypothetical protein GTO89_13345 [Heliobacterium gestii]|uniref:PilZ domain-containing protein n=1 Tax=Heliomicrobium gestii TaxID=2699 RepID=A0A845LCU9_HELGE|nr:PilZ domain-containing protein [Heliomicrobium gestii]MBM7867624.1 hypothetical protein [Heliomicrobium gestii]MZP44018.1 hypothetical protein [Heliomicrobium gestii]
MVFSEKRVHPRVDVNWKGEVFASDGIDLLAPVQIHNISFGGLLLICDRPLVVHERYQIQLPMVKTSIEIAWKHKDRYGAMFVDQTPETTDVIQTKVNELLVESALSGSFEFPGGFF